MDFRAYILAVETQLNQMTEAQKTEWIYAQARTVDTKEREKFLDSLEGKQTLHIELKPKDIIEWCDKIDEGKLYFETEEYEYYEEWGRDSEWGIQYRDIFGIVPFFEKAVHTCYQLLWNKKYKSTFQLLDRLCRLEFQTEGSEYGLWDDEEGLTIEKLAEEGLLSMDFQKLLLSLLYACYQTYSGQNRIKKIYAYFQWKLCDKLVMTEVFAYGPEKLTDEESFMKQWRQFLMQTSGDRAAELLTDACIYLGGEAYLLQTAAENTEQHPYLYKAYCERKLLAQEYEACISAAKAAVQKIDANKMIRADIANLAIRSAKKAGMEDVGFWYRTAFYSNPNSYHLLRLYQLKNRQVLEAALNRIHRINIWSAAVYSSSAEDKKAVLYDKKQKLIFRFLLGDYQTGLQACQKETEYLGWSFDLKGVLVPLLLLFLKKEEDKPTNAEKKLIRNIKEDIRFKGENDEDFDVYFSIWRNNYTMPEDTKEQCIQWLRGEIDKRTEAVVGGGYRNSYHKAAELIVVLGALLEERGEVNGMANLITHYKTLHSRKRAFRSEIDELAEKC